MNDDKYCLSLFNQKKRTNIKIETDFIIIILPFSILKTSFEVFSHK